MSNFESLTLISEKLNGGPLKSNRSATLHDQASFTEPKSFLELGPRDAGPYRGMGSSQMTSYEQYIGFLI